MGINFLPEYTTSTPIRSQKKKADYLISHIIQGAQKKKKSREKERKERKFKKISLRRPTL